MSGVWWLLLADSVGRLAPALIVIGMCAAAVFVVWSAFWCLEHGDTRPPRWLIVAAIASFLVGVAIPDRDALLMTAAAAAGVSITDLRCVGDGPAQ